MHHSSSGELSEAPAPRMFQRASDVPDSLPSVRHGGHVATLHREWTGIATSVEGEGTSWRHRFARLARRLTGRGSLGVDRVMIANLIRAIDAVAERCDVLTERLAHQDIVVDDAVSIFGEELTRIRVQLTAITDGSTGDAQRHLLHNE
jgi:hypothetical protein